MVQKTTFDVAYGKTYTVAMGLLLPLTAAPVPITANVRKLSLVYASILVVFAVSQLFLFEDLRMHFQMLWEGYYGLALAVSMIIVIAEVAALPFLLGMQLGKGLRWASMAAGLLVPLLWLLIVGCILTNQTQMSDIGFLAGLVTLEPGLWAVFFCLALGILSIWASWGMWPGRDIAKK